MSTLPEDPRWEHVSRARWFGGKGRGAVPLALDALDWFAGPAATAQAPASQPPGVRSEILTVGYPDSSREFYQLLLSYRAEPLDGAVIGHDELGWIHDATKDPEAISALVRALAHPRSSPDGPHAGPSALRWAAHLQQAQVFERPLAARPFEGEQSNSTVFLGDSALVKFFRRLEPGHNIDVELHAALGRSGVHDVDALYGWVDAALPEHIAGQGARADLLMVSQQLEVLDEGWTLGVHCAGTGTDFGRQATELGAALARVHAALARALPTEEVDGGQLADAMTARLDAAAAQAPQLARLRGPIAAVFDRLRGRRLAAQRIHGDFHLGQTLSTSSGWKIIDWEGEPLKSLAQRARPDSVWRDVAGMLRSLGYARAVGHGTPAWQRQAADAFLTAYQTHATTPPDTDTLSAYVVDKAVYEVVYETHNRPGWVHIPMQAVMDIVAPGGTATRRPEDGS
ncbi:maltokinase [Propionibacterium cyclohexanicum]|uniref:Maltokinase n=1 Tax=Propionibacterium cyclohexanicum TaxID=64702 RepID=A0A1H9R217_9ACTN|nr:phosphotransferase [Propionibacterium cyclohexanicum]SER66565.1 maltokinase [Propionibacterium cyclohexanicum]